jgi:hypothetical protein
MANVRLEQRDNVAPAIRCNEFISGPTQKANVNQTLAHRLNQTRMSVFYDSLQIRTLRDC